jgi:Polyketide cyclase / dehydrase and lipid transport
LRTYQPLDELAAPAAAAWRVLTDLRSWASWNSLIPRAEGELLPGATVTLHIQDAKGRPQPFRARVVSIHAGSGLVFEASLGSRWLLHMTHGLAVEALAADRCRLRQTWRVTGLATLPLWRSLHRDMQRFSRIAVDLGEAALNPASCAGGSVGGTGPA